VDFPNDFLDLLRGCGGWNGFVRLLTQGLKPLLNTLRDGTTEVVSSRTHRSPKGVFSFAMASRRLMETPW